MQKHLPAGENLPFFENTPQALKIRTEVRCVRQKTGVHGVFYVQMQKRKEHRMEQIKEMMIDYWTQRAPDFSALRQKELSGEKSHLWLAELERYLPKKEKLRILDIGTGTGFFSILLAARGHQVTGIDLTPEMIDEARQTASNLGLAADFQVMDGENPAFAPGSFDAIVSRNLTWTLPHLEQAYAQWHSLLKPQGVLINFDADYCREEQKELPSHHAHENISSQLWGQYEEMKSKLRPRQRPRPQWGVELLQRAGFHQIAVDQGVWQRLYPKEDVFYNPTPIFAITARA